MSKVYVANCMRQNRVIHYRLDFNAPGQPRGPFRPPRKQMIPPGKQVPLGGDLELVQVEDVVQQLNRAHAVPVSEIGRLKRFAPLCFALDKPVPENAIRSVMAINAGVQIKQGQQLRQKAAVAVDNAIADAVSKLATEQGIEVPVEAAPTAVSVEQQEQSEAGESRIEEGYKVDRTGKGGKGGKGRTRKK